jgi:hypothetical protein
MSSERRTFVQHYVTLVDNYPIQLPTVPLYERSERRILRRRLGCNEHDASVVYLSVCLLLLRCHADRRAPNHYVVLQRY